MPPMSKEKVKKIWTETFAREVLTEKLPFKAYIAVSIIVNLLVIITVLGLTYFKRLPPEVPTFYGEPEGEAQLASNYILVLPAIVSLILLGVNTGISYVLEDDFLKKILIIAGTTITILSTITTIKILSLVGYF